MTGPAGRPAVSVVMPFAGTAAEAARAASALRTLDIGPDDELILADNSGTAAAIDGVTVVRAGGEQSPAHARNAGAAAARRPWLLFLDADCEPAPGLLAAYFAAAIPADVGALAGEISGDVQAGDPLAARYGAARGFLGLGVHLSHPYLPRAAAANLLVRREAFVAIGGFFEGVRAAEDTDFSWRLQRAGWRLAPCPGARVRHRYRTTVPELRRQWRGYAAGRAWLARRYEDFEPEPALRRAARRGRGRIPFFSGSRRPRAGAGDTRPSGSVPPSVPRGLRDRAAFLALDAVLGVEELAGFALSNRPAEHPAPSPGHVAVVLVADRFPVLGDPLAEYAASLAAARVEAAARPERADPTWLVPVVYREDDGAAARWRALVRLTARHPWRVLRDRRARRRSGDSAAPRLIALAPAVLRLAADGDARVRALGGPPAAAVARRLAALAGRSVEGDA
ncbi:MAG TPA: glycosyltransferase [Solirubrobacteraceae bacterium]|nr:glycosyltransferase [Solirubrobacteraceae bacterium]